MRCTVLLAVVAMLVGAFDACGAEPQAVVKDLHKKVVLPEGYEADQSKQWPVWIHLHGGWPRKEGEIAVVEQEDVYKKLIADKPAAIIVAPLCPPDRGWDDAELNKMLDGLLKEYRIDQARIYLSGGSMGGYGAFSFAKANSHRIAGMIILCGTSEIAGAGMLRGVPIWIFHGLRDEYVPFLTTQDLVQAVVNAGGSVRFSMYGDLGHDIGKRATAEPDFVSWMLAQKKKAQ